MNGKQIGCNGPDVGRPAHSLCLDLLVTTHDSRLKSDDPKLTTRNSPIVVPSSLPDQGHLAADSSCSVASRLHPSLHLTYTTYTPCAIQSSSSSSLLPAKQKVLPGEENHSLQQDGQARPRGLIGPRGNRQPGPAPGHPWLAHHHRPPTALAPLARKHAVGCRACRCHQLNPGYDLFIVAALSPKSQKGPMAARSNLCPSCLSSPELN